MENTPYIELPGIQIVMFVLISIVLSIIFFLFIKIKKKKQKLIEYENNSKYTFEENKMLLFEKLNDPNLMNRPKSIYFLLEKSLKYFKEDFNEKDYTFFLKEFEKINPKEITEEDVIFLKKYFNKISKL